ncbi:uncharacterized protein LOC127741145 isoform X2 [Arachis duranensis]|uniref:Uncharacterized protein LOC127741145 isoform X2 n=1 Tax=Arachis duranensis TaxID=130453 RepID=A0A9C6T775_ARADU|nr:uncharacterized protein LOC127741145 isoform X2 [Arachis duranensis]
MDLKAIEELYPQRLEKGFCVHPHKCGEDLVHMKSGHLFCMENCLLKLSFMPLSCLAQLASVCPKNSDHHHLHLMLTLHYQLFYPSPQGCRPIKSFHEIFDGFRCL